MPNTNKKKIYLDCFCDYCGCSCEKPIEGEDFAYYYCSKSCKKNAEEDNQ